MKYLPEGALSEEKAKELVNSNIGSEAEKLQVVLKNENQLIGHWFFISIGNHGLKSARDSPGYQHKGYATEAAKAIWNTALGEGLKIASTLIIFLPIELWKR